MIVRVDMEFDMPIVVQRYRRTLPHIHWYVMATVSDDIQLTGAVT